MDLEDFIRKNQDRLRPRWPRPIYRPSRWQRMKDWFDDHEEDVVFGMLLTMFVVCGLLFLAAFVAIISSFFF